MQAPTFTAVTVLPAIVQTVGVVLAKVTARPELAVALTVLVPPYCKVAGEKPPAVMVWLALLITIEIPRLRVPALESDTTKLPLTVPGAVGVPEIVTVLLPGPLIAEPRPGVPAKLGTVQVYPVPLPPLATQLHVYGVP